MKPVLLLTIAILTSLSFLNAQNKSIESEIEGMDKQEAEAVLKHDTLALERIWAYDFTVNTPYNLVAIRNRGDRVNLYYSKFERNPEKVHVLCDSVVSSMGNEVIIRNAPMTLAGQTLTRRYTHVWIKRDGTWQLATRHANFICPDMPKRKLQ